MSNRKIVLDLHHIYKDGNAIDVALIEAMDEAHETGAKQLEIIHGKGSGQLKKWVLRFLQQKDVAQRYHRLQKDQHNHGRTFVHFK